MMGDTLGDVLKRHFEIVEISISGEWQPFGKECMENENEN